MKELMDNWILNFSIKLCLLFSANEFPELLIIIFFKQTIYLKIPVTAREHLIVPLS